jgi:hypothetical protein
VKEGKKMKSILKKLYYSNLSPDENLYNEDSEYLKLNDQIVENIELLKRKVSDEDFKIITTLLELHTAAGSLDTANSFVNGFKYGSLIMLEVMNDTK